MSKESTEAVRDGKRKPIIHEKCDERLVDVALVNEGETTKGTLAQKVDRLQKAFDRGLKKDPQSLMSCDVCNGESPGEPRYSKCPFCGDGDPGEGGEPAVVVAAPAEIVPAGPGVLDLDGAPCDPAELDRAVERVRECESSVKGSFWDLGRALGEIERGKLHLARRRDDGSPLYQTFDEFVKAELDYSPRHVRNIIDTSHNFSREEVARIGATKLTPLLRLSVEEREGMLGGLEGKSVREVRDEVAQIADGRPSRSTERETSKYHPPRPTQKPAEVAPAPTPPPAPPPSDDSLTLILRKGDEFKAMLYSSKTPKKRAKRVDDEPRAVVDLGGGVGLDVRLVSTSSGLVLRLRPVEVADPAAAR